MKQEEVNANVFVKTKPKKTITGVWMSRKAFDSAIARAEDRVRAQERDKFRKIVEKNTDKKYMTTDREGIADDVMEELEAHD